MADVSRPDVPRAPRVVLVEPRHPANIGFVARLLANFGLADWAIVGGPVLEGSEAERTAAMALGSLAAARRTTRFDDALADCTHLAGFTARAGRHRRVLELPELAGLREEWGPAARVALVFGREDRGLETDEAERCTALLRIPVPGLASLNLSHAVGVALYEWFRESVAAAGQEETLRWSTDAEKGRVVERTLAELHAAGFEGQPEHVAGALRRLGAQPVEARDLAVLERMLRHARWLREKEEG